MDAADGLHRGCAACGWAGETASPRCPECGGQLAVEYDAGGLQREAVTLGPGAESMWAASGLLPALEGEPISMGEGATPLVECPRIASDLEAGIVHCKDEGQNPTGTIADRACSVVVSAVAAEGAADVALPTTGADGVAAAAYAARAGLDAHVFVPTRCSHTTKAMINVHGGDMTVVEGRLPDAEAAFAAAVRDREADADAAHWAPIAPANAPLRTAGFATVLPELVAAGDGDAPDHVVVPTGHGEVLAGLLAAGRSLVELGVLDGLPALHAVQPEGCAPIVQAAEEGVRAVTPWETPDTICGALEVPEPAAGAHALAAVRESGGRAVSVDDEAILASACRLAAGEGLELGIAGGAAAAGAWELSEAGAFGAEDTVVLLNTGAGSLDSDVLRSHLMRAG